MGIPISKIKLTTFAAAGALAAFAGVVSVSYTGGATTSTGGGVLLLEGIGATVVGGVSLLGGRGSVWGAFCGALLLAAVQNGLALLQLQFYVVYIAQGGVVLFALLADSAIRHRLVRR
jgi:ribose/xylose/arabinose/galactoside ABC-type transport system permease subunit